MNVSASQLQDLNISSQHGELQWMYITNDYCKNIIIANCYRPHAGDVKHFITLLEDRLITLDMQKNDIFVLGDFNIDFSTVNCDKLKRLRTLFEQYGFNQKINLQDMVSLRTACWMLFSLILTLFPILEYVILI